jgi:hypothetical protein
VEARVTDQILNIELPNDVPTAFADFASLWHTPDVFVLDFIAMTSPPQSAEGPDGEEITAAQGRVIQRVKIPPKQVFELMKALEQQLSAWETEQA